MMALVPSQPFAAAHAYDHGSWRRGGERDCSVADMSSLSSFRHA